MSHQARDGATQADLQAIAEAALRAWPSEPGPPKSPASAYLGKLQR
jgi:hypothetical protein